MMAKSANIVVIGGGVIGTSTAFHLAEAGHENIVLNGKSNTSQKTALTPGPHSCQPKQSNHTPRPSLTPLIPLALWARGKQEVEKL